MFIIPLKAKYRQAGRLLHRQWDPPEGTWTYNAGRFSAKKAGNSGTAQKAKQGTGPRRRQGLGAVGRD